MKCKQLIEILERHSPVHIAEAWDNVGLLAGRAEKEVQKVLLSLDATSEAIEQAVQQGADLLITHHPLIFTARKKVTTEDGIGRRLVKLLQHDISYYAMHTNFDIRGMADLSAKYLNLTETDVLETTAIMENGKKEGIGRVGTLPKEMGLKELAEYVKECFRLPYVTVSGDFSKEFSMVAISTGSGKSMVESAIVAGVSVLITGDIDHHTAIDAKAEGLSIIDAGHYGTEKIFVEYMDRYLREQCPKLDICMAKETSPFSIV